MKALAEALEMLAKGLALWLQALFSPARSVAATLRIEDKEKRLSTLVVVWIWSLVIGVVIQTPLLRLYGIDLSDIGFLLPNALFTSMGMLITIASLHLCLRLFRVPSQFFDTFSVYVMTSIVYFPVWALLFLPGQASDLQMMRELKASSQSLESVFWGFLKSIQDMQAAESMLVKSAVLVTSIAFPLALWSLAIFSECITQAYKSTRYKVQIAVALAYILQIPVIAVTVTPLSRLLLWSYIK